ncbi:MAG: hypothetical protein JWM89_3516 [Acidimicrobiales bacterium]|nr:hypothetical protein [Acidimicrobiales bacterium]
MNALDPASGFERSIAEQRVGGRGYTRTTSFSLEEFAAAYVPADLIGWSEVEEFVRRGLLASEVRTYSHAQRTARALTMLARHCVSAGVPLDPERALHPDRVGHFVATDLAGMASACDWASDLSRVGRRLTRNAPWIPKRTFGRGHKKAPLSESEIAALSRLVRTQTTDGRRRAGQAFLFLGLGAGLDGRWATRIAPSDVGDEARGVVVHVPGPKPRTVPVADRWAQELIDLARSTETTCLVGQRSTSANRASALTQSIKSTTGDAVLDLGRLRSTWLVNRMLDGLALPTLLREAGLISTSQLDGMLPYVDARLAELEGKVEPHAG